MQNRKRKWLKRATAMIVSAIISLTCAMPTTAISSGSSAKITKQYVKYAHLDGSRTGGYSGVTVNGKGRHYTRVPLLWLSDGKPLYCVQLESQAPDTGETIKAGGDIKKTTYWDNLSDAAQTGITRATIYGYPNYPLTTNNDTHRRAAQYATQIIIWEYQAGSRTDTSRKTIGESDNFYRAFTKQSQYSDGIDVDLSLAADYYAKSAEKSTISQNA